MQSSTKRSKQRRTHTHTPTHTQAYFSAWTTLSTRHKAQRQNTKSCTQHKTRTYEFQHVRCLTRTRVKNSGGIESTKSTNKREEHKMRDASLHGKEILGRRLKGGGPEQRGVATPRRMERQIPVSRRRCVA